MTYASFFIVYKVSIYETYGAPFVTKVEAYDAVSGAPTTIWEGTDTDTDTTSCGSAFTVSVDGGLVSNRLRIYTATSGYEQIDAVQLCGVVVPGPPSAPPLPPSPPEAPPPCSAQIDMVLVLDNSASVGSQRFSVLSFARAVVVKFEMGANAAQVIVIVFTSSPHYHQLTYVLII